MVDIDNIIKAIEKADSIYPPVDGLIEYLPAQNYIANYFDDPHPHSNRVSCAQLNESNADETIKELIDFYKSKKVNFMWAIGPNTSPANLDSFLLKNNFVHTDSANGLYLDDLKPYQLSQTDYEIKEIPVVADSPTIATMAEGFDMPYESSKKAHGILARFTPYLTLRTYAAYTKNVAHPIGCAFTTYFPDAPLALLVGGCTLKDYRGRGIYHVLLKKRINDVIADGINTVVVIANAATSAPICTKFGFKKACELKYYTYTI